MLSKMGHRCGLALLLSAIVLTLPDPVLAQRASTPVILSFDTEDEKDVQALETLNIQQPATYFFTGWFARTHPDIVAELARENTVGSHSNVHADLAKLNKFELRKDLLEAKRSIEQATGRPVVWFRAPYLSFTDQAMEILDELGFQYDSSDMEDWAQDHALTEVPISAEEGLLVADYNMFVENKISDSDALAWLKTVYQKRAELGRPMVLLLHPRIIVQHAAVLHAFIAYVEQQGGTFQTMEQYVASAQAIHPKRWGVWVDFSDGDHDPQVVAEDAARAGITDAFVMVRDPEGLRYYERDFDSRPSATPSRDLFGDTVRLLKAKGIRVHAWIPAFHDPYLAQANPEWAMVSETGQRSSQWVSPSRPGVQADLAKLAEYLIERYGVDGIHLDYFRYPNVFADMSPDVIAAFAADAGLADVTASQIRTTYYGAWTRWRTSQIAKAADALRQTIRQTDRPAVELSAALIADAAMSFRATETYGQDYTKLAGPLDLILPMAYVKENGRPVDWVGEIALTTRFRIGNKPLLIGIEGYQKPGLWSYTAAEFDAVLQEARQGSNGIVVYPYLNLFGRGEAGANMPADSLAAFTRLSEGREVQTPAIDPRWAGIAGFTKTALSHGRSLLNLRSLPQLKPRQWAFVLFGIVGVGLVGAMLTARRRTRAIATGSARDAQLMQAKGQAKQPPRWPQLRRYALGDGSYAACSALLRDLGPAGIERYRVIFMLDLLQSSGGNLAPVLDELSALPEWRRLALRYIEECNLQGYVELQGKSVSITPAGVRELSRARDDGFSSVWWRAMETRIHETITVTCSHCGAHNPTHWFWPSIECFRCGTTLDVEQRKDPTSEPQQDSGKLQIA